MTQLELNAVLFYADFLSLKAKSLPVTDTCKYFYIHGYPINSAYILDMEPVYDLSDLYFLQAVAEYMIIRDKYDEDGVESFIDAICCMKACGSVDAERMLKCIHQYSTKQERKLAFNTYKKWRSSLIYFHTITNENGDPKRKECSKYVYHAERMLGKPGLAHGVRED